jgi:hypothetical protein
MEIEGGEFSVSLTQSNVVYNENDRKWEADILASVSTPVGSTRPPIDICVVIDTSGSMLS